ncbi:unnamed protein product [Symbiodinium sp. KB8]|nr:unnamed protein product [Symbiodinium sp. KB8]
MCGRRSDGAGTLFRNFAITTWMARQLKQVTGDRQAIMSESDPEAPWTIGPDGEDTTLESGAGPAAGPPPPTPAESCGTCHQVTAWQGLSHAFSGAIIQVLNTHYATPFTGRVLTYLPQELLRPFHDMQQVVVSVRPMRPHEETHPLILEAGDDEAEPEETRHDDVGEEGPRPPSTPPPTHLLRPEAGTTTMPVPSPGEEALAAAIADITSRMEAEGRSRMNAAEERLLNEIMDPVEDEEEIGTTGPDTSTIEAGSEADPGSTTRATPKPRAKGTRKSLRWTSQLICVLCGLFRKLISAAPSCVLTHAGDNVSCNDGSESNVRQPSIGGLFQYLGDKQQKQYTPSRQAKTDCKADGRQIFTTCFNAGLDKFALPRATTFGTFDYETHQIDYNCSDLRHKKVQLHKHGVIMAPEAELEWIAADVALLPKGKKQVSLDLTAAFDLVNWGHLRQALASADIEPSVQELLLQWLRQVVYVFHHKGGTQEVRPSWGLRQGCPASPSLWAVFTALLSQAFDQRFYEGWSAEHAVMYADDSHLRWTFDSYSGFERAITELRLVMKIFAQFDMQINFQKTQALLLTSGTHKSKIIKHYVRTTSEGKRLLLSPGDPQRWIPLVPQAEYLGLIISYDRFEALSTRHRISKAHQRRWALASILHSRKLAKQYKLQIWRSCVQTTMLYGLHCLGLSPKLVSELQVACMKHIRAIVSDQQHLTGHTHAEIRDKYHIDTTIHQLQKAHDRELRLQAGTDWMQQWKWNQHISACFVSLQEDGGEEESGLDQDHWACPYCDSSFSTAAALKVHAQRILSMTTFGEPDQEMEEFFGPVGQPKIFAKPPSQEGLNPKRRREADSNRSRWQGREQEDWDLPGRHYGRRQGSGRDPLLLSVARLALRHEEELKLQQQDTSMVLWFSPGPNSLLPHLYQTAVAFKKRQEEDPTWGLAHVPLKQVMATAMFRELRERHHKVVSSPELQKKAEEMGWKDAQGWVFQTWNPRLRHLERDHDRKPIPETEMTNKLEHFINHMKRDVVHRFHCTRRLTETMDSKATFHLDLSVRSGISARATGQGPGSSEAPRHDQVIVRHVFANRGNGCYMNVLVQTIAWAKHLSDADASVMGQGEEFFNYVPTVEKHNDLLQVRGWQAIIADWTEAHRQQDVCEFLQHVLQYLQAPIFQGTWQARRLADSEGAVHCVDQGYGTQAIPLHLPRLPPGLTGTLEVQQLVDLWHQDRDRTTCLQAPPQIMFLQLMRFAKKHGHISKDRTEVRLSMDLHIQAFTDARLGRSRIPYKLAAYVVHHGLSPKSGHYTAHLVQDGEFWQCDDNRPALLEHTPRQNHFKDAYLLLYIRQDCVYNAAMLQQGL